MVWLWGLFGRENFKNKMKNHILKFETIFKNKSHIRMHQNVIYILVKFIDEYFHLRVAHKKVCGSILVEGASFIDPRVVFCVGHILTYFFIKFYSHVAIIYMYLCIRLKIVLKHKCFFDVYLQEDRIIL